MFDLVELTKALNHLTWPGAFAFGCVCVLIGFIIYVLFKN